MDNQITNIAIKIGELGAQTSFALRVALISAFAAIISAIIAGLSTWKLNQANKQHEKQWAYVNKVSTLIDSGIETFSRLLFNKLLIAYNIDSLNANQNLFLLQKDILVIESQLVVYGSLELADAVYDLKNKIIQTSPLDFLNRWSEIYQDSHGLLLLCRKELGEKLSEKFKDFAHKLTEIPPSLPSGITFDAKLLGGVESIEK